MAVRRNWRTTSIDELALSNHDPRYLISSSPLKDSPGKERLDSASPSARRHVSRLDSRERHVSTPSRTSRTFRVNTPGSHRSANTSPLKIRVTVETEPENMRSSSPRPTQTTTKVPLRDADGGQPPRRRRGRPRKSEAHTLAVRDGLDALDLVADSIETPARPSNAGSNLPLAAAPGNSGPPKRKRGRPRKSDVQPVDDSNNSVTRDYSTTIPIRDSSPSGVVLRSPTPAYPSSRLISASPRRNNRISALTQWGNDDRNSPLSGTSTSKPSTVADELARDDDVEFHHEPTHADEVASLSNRGSRDQQLGKDEDEHSDDDDMLEEDYDMDNSTAALDRSAHESEGFSMVSIDSLKHYRLQAQREAAQAREEAVRRDQPRQLEVQAMRRPRRVESAEQEDQQPLEEHELPDDDSFTDEPEDDAPLMQDGYDSAQSDDDDDDQPDEPEHAQRERSNAEEPLVNDSGELPDGNGDPAASAFDLGEDLPNDEEYVRPSQPQTPYAAQVETKSTHPINTGEDEMYDEDEIPPAQNLESARAGLDAQEAQSGRFASLAADDDGDSNDEDDQDDPLINAQPNVAKDVADPRPMKMSTPPELVVTNSSEGQPTQSRRVSTQTPPVGRGPSPSPPPIGALSTRHSSKKMSPVFRAGSVLQEALSSPPVAMATSRKMSAGPPSKSPTEAPNVFQGFGDASQKQLRKSIALGEMLAREKSKPQPQPRSIFSSASAPAPPTAPSPARPQASQPVPAVVYPRLPTPEDSQESGGQRSSADIIHHNQGAATNQGRAGVKRSADEMSWQPQPLGRNDRSTSSRLQGSYDPTARRPSTPQQNRPAYRDARFLAQQQKIQLENQQEREEIIRQARQAPRAAVISIEDSTEPEDVDARRAKRVRSQDPDGDEIMADASLASAAQSHVQRQTPLRNTRPFESAPGSGPASVPRPSSKDKAVQTIEPTASLDDIWQEEADRSMEDSTQGPRRKRLRAEPAKSKLGQASFQHESVQPTTVSTQAYTTVNSYATSVYPTKTPDLNDLLGENDEPMRGKLPRTWRRTKEGGNSLLYSDETGQTPAKSTVPSWRNSRVDGAADAARAEAPAAFRHARRTTPPARRDEGPRQEQQLRVPARQKRPSTPEPRGILSSPHKKTALSVQSPSKEVRFVERDERARSPRRQRLTNSVSGQVNAGAAHGSSDRGASSVEAAPNDSREENRRNIRELSLDRANNGNLREDEQYEASRQEGHENAHGSAEEPDEYEDDVKSDRSFKYLSDFDPTPSERLDRRILSDRPMSGYDWAEAQQAAELREQEEAELWKREEEAEYDADSQGRSHLVDNFDDDELDPPSSPPAPSRLQLNKRKSNLPNLFDTFPPQHQPTPRRSPPPRPQAPTPNSRPAPRAEPAARPRLPSPPVPAFVAPQPSLFSRLSSVITYPFTFTFGSSGPVKNPEWTLNHTLLLTHYLQLAQGRYSTGPLLPADFSSIPLAPDLARFIGEPYRTRAECSGDCAPGCPYWRVAGRRWTYTLTPADVRVMALFQREVAAKGIPLLRGADGLGTEPVREAVDGYSQPPNWKIDESGRVRGRVRRRREDWGGEQLAMQVFVVRADAWVRRELAAVLRAEEESVQEW